MVNGYRFAALVAASSFLAPASWGSSPVDGAAVDQWNECTAGAGEGAGMVRVALPDEIDFEDAPLASNFGEKILYRHLYEPLLRLTCEKRLVPALASSWRLSPDSLSWSFRIRDGARFWDGSPVTARDVVRSWARGAGGRLLSALGAGSISVLPEAERVVKIITSRPRPSLPRALAHPDLAVVSRAPGRRPQGTGPYRIAGTGGGRDTGLTTWTLVPHGPGAHPGVTLEFVSTPGADVRDLLAGADWFGLVLTDDPRAIQFAAANGGYETYPLHWGRVYTLLVTQEAGVQSGVPVRGADEALPAGVRESLARDAVRVDARPSRPPYWWDAGPGCDLGPELTGPPSLLPEKSLRLVYRTGDAAAKDLADRVAALLNAEAVDGLESLRSLLALPAGAAPMTVRGLAAADLLAAIRAGSERAYILALSREVFDACQTLVDLSSGYGPLATRDPRWLRTLVPLVDARYHLIASRALPLLRIDGDGVPVLFDQTAEAAR